MKNILVYCLVGLMTINACDFSTKSDGKDINLNLSVVEKELSQSDNEFTFKLIKKIDEMEEGNLFISPLSVSFAFGMVYNGASGNTKTQIADLLSMSDYTSEEINGYYKKMIEILPKLDDKVKFKIANSIWIRDNFPAEEEFINTNKKYFNAEIDYLDFNSSKSIEIINDWVSNATNDKIKKVLDEIPGDVIMYLINALYFKGDWTSKFKKSNTYDDTFYGKSGETATIKMMIQEDNFNYFEDNQMQMIDLPYGDEKFSMTVILPNQNTNIDEYLQNLDATNWDGLIQKCQDRKVEIHLPKFEMEYELQLIPALKALGLTDPFGSLADFSAMSSSYGHSLEISEVKHKTYLKVDEEGSEAAAVTVIGIKVTSAAPTDTLIMKVNRPFILAIRERENGTVLFIGKIEGLK